MLELVSRDLPRLCTAKETVWTERHAGLGLSKPVARCYWYYRLLCSHAAMRMQYSDGLKLRVSDS